MAKKKVKIKKSSIKKPKIKKGRKKRRVKAEVTIRRQLLGEVPEEYHFVLKNGRKIKSILELVDALDTMTDDIFRHHVTEMRNDFSNWLNHVFDLSDLAKEIRYIDDKIKTQNAILKKVLKELAKSYK